MGTFTNDDKLQKLIQVLDKGADLRKPLKQSSIFFHERAIDCCNNKEYFLSDQHLEYIYATLVAWGMDSQKAALPEFKNFKKSIIQCKNELEHLRNYRIETISKTQLDSIFPSLISIFKTIDATTSKSRIVSASKTLAHILPNMVCPIDRRYTLTFFYDDIKGKNETEMFEYVIREMWRFFQMVKVPKDKMQGVFTDSYPKIFDNLIMNYKREIEK